MTAKREGIHVVGVEVASLHRIRMAQVTLLPGGRVVKVTGRNKAGKSHLLNTIKEALGGKSEVLPAAINDASEDRKGHVRLELSNGFSVERRFTEAAPKGYLTVTGPDGGKYGQSKIDEWLGPLSFDPLTLFTLTSDRQREILLSAGSDPDLSKRLDEKRAEHKALYDDRTQWLSQQRKAREVPKPEGERPEPVDTSAEMERLRELQTQAEDRSEALRSAKTARDFVSLVENRKGDLRDEVVRLEAKLKEARHKLEVCEDEVKDALTAADRADKRAGKLPDPSEEIDAVQRRIATADKILHQLQPWSKWKAAQKQLEEATKMADAITADMKKLKHEEQKLIASAGIPVAGLSFDPESGEPLLNGHPLSVASGAERIRMAVGVAVAVDPELRICLVDEANDLDLGALEELDALAKEHDFHVWACRIGIEGPGEILVEDGVATSEGSTT